MKNRFFSHYRILVGVLFIMVFILPFQIPSSCLTEKTPTYTNGATLSAASYNADSVVDGTGLFSAQQKSDLTDACDKVFRKYNTHITIITTNSIGEKTPKKYLEDYYDEFLAPHSFDATALLLINMDAENRWVEIQGYGKAEYRLNGDVIENILDKMDLDLKSGYYYYAVSTFVSEVGKASSPPFYLQTWFSLLLALIIAGIVVFLMAFHSGGKMTVNENTYLDANHSRLLSRHDQYLRTTVTRRRKPQNNSSSSGGSGGGSGGGVSSGGHSQSGGGRSF